MTVIFTGYIKDHALLPSRVSTPKDHHSSIPLHHAVVYFGPTMGGLEFAQTACPNLKEMEAGYNPSEFLVDFITGVCVCVCVCVCGPGLLCCDGLFALGEEHSMLS